MAVSQLRTCVPKMPHSPPSSMLVLWFVVDMSRPIDPTPTPAVVRLHSTSPPYKLMEDVLYEAWTGNLVLRVVRFIIAPYCVTAVELPWTPDGLTQAPIWKFAQNTESMVKFSTIVKVYGPCESSARGCVIE